MVWNKAIAFVERGSGEDYLNWDSSDLWIEGFAKIVANKIF